MKLIIKTAMLLLSLCFSYQGLSATDVSENDREYQVLVSLFFDAVRIGNTEIVEQFIDAGFPVNQRNLQSYTPLMVATYQGEKKAVRLLLDSGADPCLQDKRGNTAIMGALLKREISIAKMLYQAECSPEITNKAGLSLEQFAELYGQSSVLNSLKNR
ncbi:ankyrin repeat domain-containing protein [Vibrio atypicus]|jgi:ankyrin repeat protein|uniref:ankyrin repeat domain-containing protein n=1 Tax=Vibrio atypicus TaxID=558271 RepID=UPI00135CA6EA|nr:ankyrin repeat domain-containing protein [Vibrio atypicus]